MFTDSIKDSEFIEITIKEKPPPNTFTNIPHANKCLVLHAEPTSKFQPGDVVVGINRKPCTDTKGEDVMKRIEAITLPGKIQVEREKNLVSVRLPFRPFDVTLDDQNYGLFVSNPGSESKLRRDDELVCINNRWCGHESPASRKQLWEETPFPLETLWRREASSEIPGNIDEKEREKRAEEWQKGSIVEVYSNTGQRWTLAHIGDRFSDADGEWVEVQYWDGETALSKTLALHSTNLRLPADLLASDEEDNGDAMETARKELKIGDPVEIYSTSKAQWYWGEVINQFDDEQGGPGWLEVTWNIENGTSVETLSKQVKRDSNSIRPLLATDFEMDLDTPKEDTLLPDAGNHRPRQPTLNLKPPDDSVSPRMSPTAAFVGFTPKDDTSELSDSMEELDEPELPPVYSERNQEASGATDRSLQSTLSQDLYSVMATLNNSSYGQSDDFGRVRAGTKTDSVQTNPIAGMTNEEAFAKALPQFEDSLSDELRQFKNMMRAESGLDPIQSLDFGNKATFNVEKEYMSKRIAMLEDHQKDVETRLRESQQKADNLTMERDELRLKFDTVVQKMRETAERIKKFEKERIALQHLTARVEEQEKEIKQLETHNSKLQTENTQLQSTQQSIEELKKEHEKYVNELMDEHDNELAQEKELADAKALEKITGLKGEKQEMELQISQLKQEMKDLQTQNQTLRKKSRNLNRADEEVVELRHLLEQKDARILKLQEQFDEEIDALMGQVGITEEAQTQKIQVLEAAIQQREDLESRRQEEIRRIQTEFEQEKMELRMVREGLQRDMNVDNETVQRLRVQNRTLKEELQNVTLKLQRLKAEVESVISAVKEEAQEEARDEINRQLEEYRGQAAIQIGRLQDTVTQVSEENQALRYKLDRLEQKRQDAKRMKQALLQTDVEIKWPKTSGWGRSYVKTRITVKHKELGLETPHNSPEGHRVKKLPWLAIREVKTGEKPWQFVIVLQDAGTFKVKCPNERDRDTWLKQLRRVHNQATESYI